MFKLAKISLENRYHLRNAVIIVIFLNILSFSFAQGFDGGSGTAADPWQISNATQLSNLNNYIGNQHQNKHFIQTADISLNIYPWNEGNGWIPIGDWLHPFRGNYNGNGFVISDLMINNTEGVASALFGNTFTANIYNLGVINATVTGSSISSVLVGEAFDTTIFNCFTSGVVSGHNDVGGLAGHISGTTINNSYSLTDIEGNQYLGGLVGYSYSSPITNCYSAGSVRKSDSLQGGLYIGGLIGGGASSDVESSYWNRDSSGLDSSAAGEGKSTLEMVNSVTFAGWDFSDTWIIEEGYSYPALQFQQPAAYPLPGPAELSGTSDVGANFLEWNEGLQPVLGYNLYRDDILLNTENLIAINEFADTEAAVFNPYYYRVTSVVNWGGEIRETLPSNYLSLTVLAFSGGSGVETDPFLIGTAEELSGIRYSLSSHYRLISDIDIGVAPWNSGTGWSPIGKTEAVSFNGSLDGADYTISGLFIHDSSANPKGLFGHITTARIEGVKLSGVYIEAESIVGPLIGYAVDSIIINCYSTGTIFGPNTAGGLIGLMQGSIISNSHASGEVTGSWDTGGLIGNTIESSIYSCFAETNVAGSYSTGGLIGSNISSTVSNTFSTGSVFGYMRTGGLIGNHAQGGIVSFSYSTGNVTNHSDWVGGLIGFSNSPVENSYWNIETSLQDTSAGGVGLTTEQMIQESSFQGWNFAEEWQIVENVSYPALVWQQPYSYQIPALQGLVATLSAGNVELTWQNPITPAVGYNVYRDGILLNDNLLTINSYTDESVDPWTEYEYRVKAVYSISNLLIESLFSDPVNLILLNFTNGTGTPNDPYLVEFADQLNGIRFSLNSYYRQIADIDLGVYPWNQNDGWQPIGKGENPFSGSYDGDGFSISNLFINRPEHSRQGLFGTVESAQLANISILFATLQGAESVGGIAGFASNSSISNSFVQGELQGESQVGGLIGSLMNSSTIDACSTAGSVIAQNSMVGGLIGHVGQSIVENSISSCSVAGNSSVGGLIGNKFLSTTGSSYSSGEVSVV